MDVIDAIGNTPLIELTKVSAGLPVKIFIKCEHLNPGGSIKAVSYTHLTLPTNREV